MRQGMRFAAVLNLQFFLIFAGMAAEPWAAPFAKPEWALLDAAARIQAAEGQGVVELLDEAIVRFDAQGRTTRSRRKMFKIEKQSAVEDYSSIERSYEPWHEQRPTVRARVITADGVGHWLDPKTVADVPADQRDGKVYSDRRIVRAPLPAVAAGALIEYEFTGKQNAPLFEAGVTERVSFDEEIRLERFHVVVEAPAKLGLKLIHPGIADSAVRRSENGGLVRYECELGPLKPRDGYEWDAPPDVVDYPYLGFTTGTSWAAVAASYADAVERQSNGAEVGALLEGLDRSGSQRDVIGRLMAAINKRVRYTGIEFGKAAIVPARPAEVLKRGYGDCKDKATLLVAALKAVGIPSAVALLRTGPMFDVDPELPGMGLFDHAIVRAATTPPVWIDATAENVRIGQLPANDTGRWALVAEAATTDLVKTPDISAADNGRRHTIEIRMPDYGAGEVTETIEAWGEMERGMRALPADAAAQRKALEDYVKRDYLAGALGSYTVPQPDDLSKPYRRQLQALKARRALTDMGDAVVAIFPMWAMSEMPDHLLETGEPDKPRRHGYYFAVPHRMEYRYRIQVAPLFRLNKLPESKQQAFGPARLECEYKRSGDDVIEAVIRFDSGPRSWTVAEYETFRKAVREHYRTPAEMLSFSMATAEPLALGDRPAALKIVREAAARPDASAMTHVRYSRLLVEVGLAELALAEARRATELAPKSSQAWQALGWVYQHDRFGRRFRGDWNSAEAEKCYRKAMEVEPDDKVAMLELAILLEESPTGQRYGTGARLKESIELYRTYLKDTPNATIEGNLFAALMWNNDLAGARAGLPKLADSVRAATSLVLTAMAESPARAIIEAQSAYSESGARSTALASAAASLYQFRRYEAARQLLKAAIRLAPSDELTRRQSIYERMKPAEEALLKPDQPAWPVQMLIYRILSRQVDEAHLKPLMSRVVKWNNADSELPKLAASAEALMEMMARLGLSEANCLDLLASMMEFDTVGEAERGYWIKMLKTGDSPTSMFVSREGDGYRIVGAPEDASGVGELALDLLAHNDLTGARWWLDFVMPKLSDKDSAGGRPAPYFLWPEALPGKTREAGRERVAAAALAGKDPAMSAVVIEILTARRKQVSTALERAQLDRALCETLAKAKRWPEMLEAARRLERTRNFEATGGHLVLRALEGAGHWDELLAEAGKGRAKDADDLYMLRAQVTALLHLGRTKDAAGAAGALLQQPGVKPADRTLAAWCALLGGGDVAKSLKDLTTNAGSNPAELGSDYWYAVAALHLAAGQTAEAYNAFTRGLSGEQLDALDARGWAVWGRLAGRYGYPEVESAAHARIAKTANASDPVAHLAELYVKGSK